MDVATGAHLAHDNLERYLGPTSGSIAAARGKKKVGESVWLLKRCSKGAWAEPGEIWPSRLDSRDLTPDMVHEEAGD